VIDQVWVYAIKVRAIRLEC